jgi:hypothetical protein
MQHELLDRRRVYQILHDNGIRTPRHVVLNAEERSAETVRQCDDWIEINGIRFNKPVVEKPVDSGVCRSHSLQIDTQAHARYRKYHVQRGPQHSHLLPVECRRWSQETFQKVSHRLFSFQTIAQMKEKKKRKKERKKEKVILLCETYIT